MEKELFDILKERGYVKDLTHEKEIIDLINGEPMTFIWELTLLLIVFI